MDVNNTDNNENLNNNTDNIDNTDNKGLFDDIDDNVENNDNNDNTDNTDSKPESKGLFDDIEDTEQEWRDLFGEVYDDEKEQTKIKTLINKYTLEDGKLDTKNILKSLYNANKLVSKKGLEAPESYEFEKSEDLDFDFDNDILESFKSIAKENNLTNEQFNKIVNDFGFKTKEILEAATKSEFERIQNEIKKIDNFKDRALNIKRFMSKNLTEEQARVLSNSIPSKEMFEVIEAIIDKAEGRNQLNQPSGNNTADVSKVQSELEEIREKMATTTDTAEFERLYRRRDELLGL